MIILKHQLNDGKIPFDAWMDRLKDRRARAKILVRLARIELGNFGDCRSVGEGVNELKIPEGKGYRVYYGREGNDIVLLLCGGNKATQNKDIGLAKKYWSEYNERA